MTDDLADWAKKCMSCIHCYKKRYDADYLYCRLKSGCRYETKDKKNTKDMEKRIAELEKENAELKKTVEYYRKEREFFIGEVGK